MRAAEMKNQRKHRKNHALKHYSFFYKLKFWGDWLMRLLILNNKSKNDI